MSDKEKISNQVVKDNQWTASKEQKCKKIARRRAAFVWLHNRTARQYNYSNSIWEVIILIGSYILGAANAGLTFIVTDRNKTKYINLVLGIAVIAIGILATIRKKLNYAKKIKKQIHASSQNSSLFLDIRQELTKTRDRRQKYRKFHSRITDKEYKITQSVPTIPKKIMKEYYKKFAGEALSYKDLFAGFEIDVAADDVTNQNQLFKKPSVRVIENGRKNDITIAVKGSKLSSKQRYELEKYYLD